jgi:hypothetical protein
MDRITSIPAEVYFTLLEMYISLEKEYRRLLEEFEKAKK